MTCSISKCNAKSVTSTVNGTTFSFINDSVLGQSDILLTSNTVICNMLDKLVFRRKLDFGSTMVNYTKLKKIDNNTYIRFGTNMYRQNVDIAMDSTVGVIISDKPWEVYFIGTNACNLVHADSIVMTVLRC